MATPTPFKIAVSEEQLSWIDDRVRTGRLPPNRDHISADETWKSWGVPVNYAQRLKDHWINEYNWRRVEKRLNDELKQFTVPVRHRGNEIDLHFLHHRSERKGAIPLLIVHGWPGSFLEITPAIEHLTNPPSLNDQAYHVIVPSLPGFGFSSYPSEPCSPMDMADIMLELMAILGYRYFMAQGGDWGAQIVRILATAHPDNCRAVHMNMVVTEPPSLFRQPLAFAKLVFAWLTGGWNLTAFEKKMLDRMQWWLMWEYGYNAIQSTKPLTLSYGLTDSPLGMICWLRGMVNYIFDDEFEWKDEDVITWAMPYIINGSAGHAEIYKWTPRGDEQSLSKAMSNPIPRQVAFGASAFPKDIMYVPRWWASGTLAQNVVFWREHNRGGHFPCYESPAVLAADLRAFTSQVDESVVKSMQGASSWV